MTGRQRRIEALQQLIARPGTPEEGEAARRALERVLASPDTSPEPEPIFHRNLFEDAFFLNIMEELQRENNAAFKTAAEEAARLRQEHEGRLKTFEMKFSIDALRFQGNMKQAGEAMKKFAEALRKSRPGSEL